MATEENARFKSKRTVLRSTVTKFCNKIETSLLESDIDLTELEEILVQLENKSEELRTVDREIEQKLTPEEFDREFQTVEEYQEKIIKWSFRAKRKIKEINRNTFNTSASTSLLNPQHTEGAAREQANIKLPKLSIPKFFGDSSQWLSFWNSFESAIHKNESLNKIDKFNYLKAHLGGAASSCIEGFSLSPENYDSVVKLLENRFGRKDILINAHLNNLLNISPLKSVNDLKTFRNIVDKCNTQIRSLENLGVESENFGSILCPLLLKLLPSELVLAFSKIENIESQFKINSLMDFLSRELNSREKAFSLIKQQTRSDESRNDFLPPSSVDRYERHKKSEYKSRRNQLETAASLFSRAENSDNKMTCLFCNKYHRSESCLFAKKLSLDERKSILMRKGVCFKCLNKFHVARYCRNKLMCTGCGKDNHLEIMCDYGKPREINRHVDRHNLINESNLPKDEEKPEIKLGLGNQSYSNKIYLQTLIVRVQGINGDYFLRAIYDSGSENSYLSKYAAKILRLKRLNDVLVTHCLFGGREVVENHSRYKLKLSNIDRSYSCQIEVLDQDKICSLIPKIEDRECIRNLKERGIYLSDVFHRESLRLFEENPREVHLLLGADVAANLFTGVIKRLPYMGLSAWKTKLGWVLFGKTNAKESNGNGSHINSLSALSLSLQVSDNKISDLWRLDILGIVDQEENKTKNILAEETMRHFSNTVKRDEEGRYEIALPWILEREILPNNLNLAKKCLDKVGKRLVDTNRKEDYEQVFREWESNGIIECISARNSDYITENSVHYLPHHPVIKETSETTKVRPVFNASARMKNSPSLNDCLTKGPNLIEIIPRILNRFRKYKIGISSDIEKAFLQISVRKEDRDYLRFLWLGDAGNHPKIYRHNRVVFGLSSSPFLLAATLNHLLDQTPENFEETVRLLRNSFYVDNCLISLKSVEETEKFIEDSRKILSTGCFNLRCWQSNEPNSFVQNSTNENVPVLGMMWDLRNDTLACKIAQLDDTNDRITKRKLLSLTQKVFDPVGYTAPVILVPKTILQETWHLKLGWDDELPPSLCKQFKSWLEQLPFLNQIQIPRWLNIDSINENNATLHVFCDASKRAYATCVFIRTENTTSTTVRLVSAKSRVAPLKSMTIPRLELLSCLIGARLVSTVIADLQLPEIKIFLWSDSSTALAWIKNEDQWGTFVHNRVKEIRSLTKPSAWRHVSGQLNPADLPSRGCSADRLLKSKWWEGPEWLKENPNDWPQSEISPNIEIINAEKRKSVLSAISTETETLAHFERISSYKKLIRVTAWILRFLNNVRIKINEKKRGNLSVEELANAEKIVLKKIQKDYLKENGKNIQTFVDPDGLQRVKSKISYRTDLEAFRHPVLLPAKHPIVRKIIFDKHVELCHAGIQILMSALREDFWIVKSRKTIRQAIRNCVTCQRFKGRPIEVPSPPLPLDRIREARVFQVTGVDLCGPLHLRDRTKSWVVLFTCAVYRGVHLELVTSLSTDSFMLALRRFISRRGRPDTIYSDNGTNMVGTHNELRAIDWNKIGNFSAARKIEWKFNPPSAPWWGGFWERLIGILKQILKKVLGKASLGYEELFTVLCDAESVINSRPLTYMSEDVEDLIALTPAMFMQEIKETGVPDFDYIDSRKLNKRFLYRQKLCQDLRGRFRSEYLGQLKDYSKNRKESAVKEGDVVLIGDNNVRRINWPLAMVTKLYPGKDGKTRVVGLKTKSGSVMRPVQRLYPLEINSSDFPSCPPSTSIRDAEPAPPTVLRDLDIPDAQDKDVQRSRYGRLLRPPQRLNLTV